MDANNAADKKMAPTSTDKRLTFRRRRLSFPKHHLSDEDESHNANEEDTSEHTHDDPTNVDSSDKAQTFRKRRLSLTLSKIATEEPAAESAKNDMAPRPPQRRRSSAASAASNGSVNSEGATGLAGAALLVSRTVHAAELLTAGHAPPSPAVHNPALYQHDTRPLPPSLLLAQQQQHHHHHHDNPDDVSPRSAQAAAVAAHYQPRWKKSHAISKAGEEHKLPFPRDIVGTYSCHGVEPIYDSGYEEEEDWNQEGKGLNQNGNGHGATKPTSAAKINQDRGGVAFPYGNSPKTALFAVYDGHGQGGEQVSQFALHEIQRRLEKHAHFRSDLEHAFKETFLGVDRALQNEPLIEPVFAGTTACVALLRGGVVTCANAGDSRAVVAQRNPTKHSLSAIDLTIDQNPDLPEEMRRIHEAGGFVSPPPAPGLSARVWLDPNCTQIGLAMARSIGDHAVAPVGVIAEPVVSKYSVCADDEFLILASDGVWEFVTSQEAVEIVGEHLDRGATKACQALIEAAAAKWHEEEGDYRDDITALVVCLQDLWTDDDDA